jgi:GH24 family phage-related lysozyme (muramidase)
LTAALVDGLLTTFVYDGDGRRLQMSIAGEVVTYTLDYAGGGRVLLEEGGAFSDTKHYLYGLECIAELVDADEPESEWRYYHQDGNHLVRQTTNMAAAVTLAWTYSPEGAILLGEEGPVTHLGCDGNTTYDFSTGLIFKNGRYFDPNTGIWITLSGMVVWNEWQTRPTNRYQRKRSRNWLLLLLLFLVVLALAGCTTTPSPTPTATPCPTPSVPGLPSNTPGAPTNTPGAPNTPTPIPTSLPPTGTPFPPTPTPVFQPTQISQDGAEFIARFESFVPNLYNDSEGHCTVGYGHLVHLQNCNFVEASEKPFLNGISEAEGLQYFRSDLAIYEQAVNRSVTVPLAQNQYDALVSFAFNVGPNGFANSDLVLYLNQGNYSAVPEQMMLWTNFGDPGLTRRREFEITLFRDGIYRTDW